MPTRTGSWGARVAARAASRATGSSTGSPSTSTPARVLQARALPPGWYDQWYESGAARSGPAPRCSAPLRATRGPSGPLCTFGVCAAGHPRLPGKRRGCPAAQGHVEDDTPHTEGNGGCENGAHAPCHAWTPGRAPAR
ncbi:unnamed protein product [Prorocentrum cordatum]|uniref:Secreted protein n=1 Tax=Prorocentrum cordatum TaxID=2364126 RepID=A0ABN9VCP4_9DINO|nr:unnamed protein product [Polarella glacialis]